MVGGGGELGRLEGGETAVRVYDTEKNKEGEREKEH